MKKRVLPLAIMYLLGNVTYAQIGVGTVEPHPSAQMEVVSSAKGILIPRIALTGITDVTTVKTGNVNSLLVFNTTDNELIKAGYYYWLNNQWIKLVSADQVSSFKNTINVSLAVVKNELVLTDSDENEVKLPWNIKELVKTNETETTIIYNGDGTYTFRNENGLEVVIDVPAAVISNFQEIMDNSSVKNILSTYLGKIVGNVTYDGIDFHYVDTSGASQIIEINEIVKANETVTTLTNNQDGSYTYINEKGVEVTLNVPAEIISNFQQIIEHTAIKNILDNYLANVVGNVTYDGIDFHYVDASSVSQTIHFKEMVTANETLTKLEIDSINRKLLYTDEENIIKELDLSPIIQEPWYKSGTEKGATLNTDNIFTLGWVGVGYEEPSKVLHEKLRVNGTITTVNSSYADYVFEDYFNGFSEIKFNYKFPDLEYVANFIKTNRHLPGITPIDALVKTDVGYAFNVSELSIQLLEKTEELYLHLIEQKKIMDEKSDLFQKSIEEKNEEIKRLNKRLERLENIFPN